MEKSSPAHQSDQAEEALPKIELQATISSTNLTRTEDADPFIITLTATLRYTQPITIFTFNNVFNYTFHDSNKPLTSECLQFTDVETLKPADTAQRLDVCFFETGPDSGFSTSSEYNEGFLTLEPDRPHEIFSTKMGPFPGPSSYYLKNELLKERNFNWDIGDRLEKGTTYRFGLKDGSEVSWWDKGRKDDVLGTWWGEKYFGRSLFAKRRVKIDVLAKERRIPLKVMDEPIFEVVE